MSEKNKVNIIISATAKGVKEAATQAQAGIKTAFSKGKEAVAAFNKETGNGHKAVSALSGAVKTMLAGFIGFNAIQKAVNIMQEADKAAWGMGDAIADANKEFNNIGSVESWQKTVAELSRELKIYSGTELKNAASRTIELTKRMGLSETQMKEVIRRTSDLSNGNLDLEQTIEAVSHGLNGQNRAVQNLGLNMSDDYVQAQYEANKANKTAWKDLSDLEKIQQRYLIFLQQTEAALGSTADSTSTFAGAMKEVKAQIYDAVANSNDLKDAMNNVAAVIKKNAGDIGEMISILVTAAARIVEFAVEWRNLLIVLASAVVSISIITKLILVINGLNAALIKLTGKGIITGIRALYTGMATLAAQSTAAGIAMRVTLIGAVVASIISIGLLIKAIYDWRKAVKAEEEAQKSLTDNTSRMMAKFNEFKGFKLPADISKATQKDLEEFRKKLASARAYYTALKMQLEEPAKETNMLGQATDSAITAQKTLEKVKERLNEIQGDFNRVGESASSAATEMEKPVKAVEATNATLDEFEKQAKKAYEEATKQASDYAKQVIEWEDKIKFAKLSTEDQIRALQRMGLTDLQQWNDQKLQADQKLYDARAALMNGDFDLAEKLAEDAKGLYAGLAKEVKGTEAGSDVVEKSINDTKQVAIDGVQAVGTFVQDLYNTQKNAAQTAQTEWTATAEGIKQQLDDIAKKREANVQITLEGLEAAQNRINEWLRLDRTMYINVVERKQPSGKKDGGPIYASIGRKLPGYGGGDKIKALLEAGEFVIRKEAVKKYGSGLFEALNAMRVDAGEIMRKKIGGMISNISMPSISVPRYAYQTGGAVAGPGETITLRLQAGNVEAVIPTYGNKNSLRGQLKALEREIEKYSMVKR
jgi:hypothetical protein